MAEKYLWWRDGVIYQIYPRSFADSNGSGIGDLEGITSRLDYLQELGVDALWLSPINSSPDVDFGYDVSDYLDIDPKFGRMADFEKLIREAEKRGIRIVMDLVLNHTSNQHEWFKQSRSSRNNAYHDWYIWHDADEKGKPPNNWQAVFGGKAWEWDESAQQYYYHMFYKEQPDVNWRNPKVRAALLDVFRFWADKGVKGFRLDVFNVYFKDALLRNNPTKLIARRPFDKQIHLYDFDQPELMDVLKDIRKILDGYPDAYAVGETFFATPEKAAGYSGKDILHAAFNFKFLENRWDESKYRQIILDWEKALGEEKWPTYVLNNHDTKRSATRFGEGEDDSRLKVAAAMLLTLRGTPYLYYGEEIGMRDIKLKRSQILDPIGKLYWPFHKGRDGCRAPMQWDASAHAGFSKSKPWLPLHPNYPERNVENQLRDRDSLLNFYKSLLILRRKEPVLVHGSLGFVADALRGVMAYNRVLNKSKALILLNFTSSTQRVVLPDNTEDWQIGLSSSGRSSLITGENAICLDSNEALILINRS